MTDRSIQVVMTENAWDGPTLLADGTTQTLTASLAGSLVQDGKARYSNPNDQTSRPGLYGDLDTRTAELAAMGVIAPGRTAALFGDSRAVQNFVDTTLTAGTYAGIYTAKGWFHHLQLLSGNAFNLIHAAGKSGDTIAMAVSRMNNPQGGAMFGNVANPGWTGARPNWLFVSLGINDILNGVETKTSVAGARTILNAARNMGATVVWPTEYLPGGEGSALSGSSFSLLLAWNSALLALRSEYYNLIVPDACASFMDPANPGYSYSGLMNDGSGTWIHPNNAGGALLGSTAYTAIGTRLPPPNYALLAGDANEIVSVDPTINQYQVNPTLAGANLGAAGVATANGGGATSTIKLIADPSGIGQAVQVDATFSSATSAYVYVTLTDSKANVLGGERLIAACSIGIGGINATDGVLDPITSANSVRTAMHSLAVTDAAGAGGNANFRNARDASDAVSAAHDAGMRSGESGISVTPPYQTKSGVPQLVQQQFYLRGTGAGSARFIISRPTIRRVPEKYIQASVL